MLLRVKTTWPEEKLPLRLPLTRPMYAAGIFTGSNLPLLPRDTNLPLLSMSLKPTCLIPHLTLSTSPEKLQVKFTEELTNPETLFPRYVDVNCI